MLLHRLHQNCRDGLRHILIYLAGWKQRVRLTADESICASRRVRWRRSGHQVIERCAERVQVRARVCSMPRICSIGA